MKNYLLIFGNGTNPASNAGLNPTFTVFNVVPGGGSTTAPGITQIPTNTGLYYFSYAPTSSVAFVVDGATTGLGSARYIAGIIDGNDVVNELIGSTLYPMGVSLTALGTTSIALFGASFLGASLQALALGSSGVADLSARIGTTASSFGTTATDPATVLGYLKRLQETNEGNQSFNKSTSAWDVYSRGSSTLLFEKTLEDSSGSVSST